MNKTKAVVIGAGPTGMRTAVYLAEAGLDVTIIEKTSKVGGMCSSFKHNDFILDYGPHKFYTQIPGVYEDFKNILGEGNYIEVKKKNSIRLLGKYFDFPVKLSQLITQINPILASKIMLDFSKSLVSGKKVESYEDYFIKGFGKTGYNLLFRGFAEKVWADPKTLSEELARRRSPVGSVFALLKSIVSKNKDVSAEYFYYPKYGYGEISNSLLKSLTKNKGKVILEALPQKIEIKNNKVKSVTIKTKKGIKKIECDVLITSAPITETPLILTSKVPQNVRDSLNKLKFRALIVSFIFLNKERALKDNWIFFPEKEFIFSRVAEQKSFSPFTGPKGKTVITAEVPCSFGDELFNSSEEKIKERVISDLIKAGLIKKEEVYDFFTRKASRVYPIYDLKYKENLEKVLSYLDGIDNIYTTGRLGLFNYNNADHCLDMAKVMADVIVNKKPREEWKKARDYFDSYRIVD